MGLPGGYTAPATVVVEHFDPSINAVVRDIYRVGGDQSSTRISVMSGGLPGDQSMGFLKVAIFPDREAGLPPGAGIVTGLSNLTNFDKVASTRANSGYQVTDMGGSNIELNDPAVVTWLSNQRNPWQIVQLPDRHSEIPKESGSTPPVPVLHAASTARSDSQSFGDNAFGSGASASDAVAPRNPNAAAPPPNSEGMIGLFSGKPMQFPFAPIFERRVSSGAAGGPSRPSALDDLISNFGRSQTSPFDAGAAAPVVSDRQAFTDSGNGAPTLTAGPAAFAPPIPTSPDPQGPLSLNEAYLEYLKRLNASQPQTKMLDTNASSPPLTPSDDANFSGGLVGRLTALLGADPESPDLHAVPQQNDPSDAADDDLVRRWPNRFA